MAYYIDTIEQIKGENDTITEYGKREKQTGTLNQALAAFYTKCANVSNDLVTDGKNHYYMDIKIVNSKGGVEKKDVIGEYFEGTAEE